MPHNSLGCVCMVSVMRCCSFLHLLINMWLSNYSVLECCGRSSGWTISVTLVTVTLHTWARKGERTRKYLSTHKVKGHGNRAPWWLIVTAWRISADSEEPWNDFKDLTPPGNQSSVFYTHVSEHTSHSPHPADSFHISVKECENLRFIPAAF